MDKIQRFNLCKTINMSVTKTMDTMAQEMFGEFGFSTCSHEERDVIVNILVKQQVNNIKNEQKGTN